MIKNETPHSDDKGFDTFDHGFWVLALIIALDLLVASDHCAKRNIALNRTFPSFPKPRTLSDRIAMAAACPCAQVNKVTLGVPARDKPHAGCALGRRFVQIKPHLDEPAAVGGADPARQACEGLAVVLREP
jgi:hypothetical protein